MSTLSVSNILTANGTETLSIKTGNTSAGGIIVNTDGSMNVLSNASYTAITVAANGGIVLGTATGGSKGSGTLNANNVLVNGTTIGINGIQLITGSATYTPTAGTRAALVILQAAGGGGGGIGSTAGGASGNYAGSGGAGETRWGVVSISGTVSVTIGASGTGGTAGNNNGTTASDSTFGDLITAKGGTFGAGSAGNTNGANGSTPTGSGGIRIDPLKGAGTPSGPYINGGASTMFGIGNMYIANYLNSGGRIGGGYGSGGSSASHIATATSTHAGGDGSPGMCLIIEFA